VILAKARLLYASFVSLILQALMADAYRDG